MAQEAKYLYYTCAAKAVISVICALMATVLRRQLLTRQAENISHWPDKYYNILELISYIGYIVIN